MTLGSEVHTYTGPGPGPEYTAIRRAPSTPCARGKRPGVHASHRHDFALRARLAAPSHRQNDIIQRANRPHPHPRLVHILHIVHIVDRHDAGMGMGGLGQSCDVPVCHGRILLLARVGGDTAPTGSLPRHPCT
eukprot:scaffold17888_cov149-Isochrysis_galbana.AAC.9